MSEYGNYYVDIFIYSPYIASDDRFEFGTVDGEPSDHLLVISKMCPSDQWCDTFFNATSGAFDIISQTDPSTSNYLTGHIVDAELVEGDLDANGRFQRTAGGEIMCVERASLQGSMDAL